MRTVLVWLPIAMVASPVLAAPGEQRSIEQQLRDPATAQKIGDSMQALTGALLDLKVGGVKAALEGRQPTAEERALTVREIERRDGVSDRELEQRVAAAKPAIAQGMQALADALPAMMKGMEQAKRAIERAAANMPSPTYPNR